MGTEFSDRDQGYLKYKTIGNDNPKGLPKVFFSCHPRDFELYFDTIWKWLSENHSLAMFYEPAEESASWDNLSRDLVSMQLIVIPVTTNLLLNDCRTVREILPFANREHIPVLPLMMENGLTDAFSMVFGKIQYLSVNRTDPTSIPFKTQLGRFLDSVLVNEDTMQKVRNAFAAYIFLSYRKKDRAYAQELMKLIHRHEQYRDIAIWYDEYLVPGEKYNEAIDFALRSSDLFALVVTPSLLEKHDGNPNYVMRIEYPRAIETGKPVVPVEMVKTDKTVLKQDFPQIPECVPKAADEELKNAILENLHHLAMKEGSPLHNFFIGLAYLDGIDVEVDSVRAVRLITSAAESGLEEAVRKLITMYHEGKGVERSYQTSLEWQIRLVQMIREKSGTREDIANRLSLILELEHLGDAYAALGRLSMAENTYEEMRKEAEGANTEYNTPETNRILIESYRKLGQISHSMGIPSKAEAWYKKALDMAQKLPDKTGAACDRKTLWMLYIKTGDCIMSQYGRMAEGSQMYRTSTEISRILVREDPSLDSRRCLVISYRKMAEFEKAIDLCRYIAEETGSVEDRRELSALYNNWAVMSLGRRSGEGGEELLKAALEIREDLAKKTESVESYRDLAKIYENLGEREKAGGMYESAETWYKASMEMRESLYRKIGSDKAAYELVSVLIRLGIIGDRKSLSRALEICKEMIRKYPEDMRFRRLVFKINELLHDDKKREDARSHKHHYQIDL